MIRWSLIRPRSFAARLALAWQDQTRAPTLIRRINSASSSIHPDSGKRFSSIVPLDRDPIRTQTIVKDPISLYYQFLKKHEAHKVHFAEHLRRSVLQPWTDMSSPPSPEVNDITIHERLSASGQTFAAKTGARSLARGCSLSENLLVSTEIEGAARTRLELGFVIWVVQTLNARVGPTRTLPFRPTWSLLSPNCIQIREVPLGLPPALHLFRSEDTRAIKLAAGAERILEEGHAFSALATVTHGFGGHVDESCHITPAYTELFVASPMPLAVDKGGMPVSPESGGAILMGPQLLDLAEYFLVKLFYVDSIMTSLADESSKVGGIRELSEPCMVDETKLL